MFEKINLGYNQADRRPSCTYSHWDWCNRIKYQIDLDNYLKFETVLKNSMATKDNDDSVFDRFDTYDFSTDEKFLNGLPNVIAALAKNKPGAMVEKAYYDREMLKARAFYFSK
jgi:hypothetical protein